ncbi:unnamed protein product [Medioppia subpectinata]|uniref:Peptidase S1 domain-containing protein n=1 Tax=Medioppia subpectinata TaxID=1979941 RepID=A0A7R9KHN6_9ACAR|nr:unnamed protein product [Medioppia subpectinata]CAG2103608.1 unnamed protein product [Medioppia subpectinata]
MEIILYLSGEGLGVKHQRCGNSDPIIRVIGGNTARPGEWPWMAKLIMHHVSPSMQITQTSQCGGSLINNEWILTAAHCLNNFANGDDITFIDATLGDYDRDVDQKKDYKGLIKEVNVHHGYDNKTHHNDIALLKLHEPLDLEGMGNFLEPICLPETGEQRRVGTLCVATDKFDPNTDYCVGNDVDAECVYKGDSGGPLNCQLATGFWVADGVVSYGTNLGCGMDRSPSIFTRVSEYIPWIKSIIGPKF